MFVLQIGCKQQTDSCNVKVGAGSYRGILLQYTSNKVMTYIETFGNTLI